MGLLLIDGSRLLDYVGIGPLNTDDNALIEFAAPKDLLAYSTKDAHLPFVFALDGRREELLGTVFVGFWSPMGTGRGTSALERAIDDVKDFVQRARDAGEDGIDRLARLASYTTGRTKSRSSWPTK